MHNLVDDFSLANVYIFLEDKLFAQANQVALCVEFKCFLVELLFDANHTSCSFASQCLL